MKIAYLILAHRYPTHITRLIEALDWPGVDFYIHIDRSADRSPFLHLSSRSNVTLIENAVKVCWGGFSLVQATLRLLNAAEQHHGGDYE